MSMIYFTRLDGGCESVDLTTCVRYRVEPRSYPPSRVPDPLRTWYFDRMPDGRWILSHPSGDWPPTEVPKSEVRQSMLASGYWPIPAELLPEVPQAPASVPGVGTTDPSPPSRESTPGPAKNDYTALADKLRLMKQPTRAALVEFRADKESAIALDVAKAVHDDELASDKTMSRNASRTNDSLRDMGSRLYFELRGGKMHRGNRPE